MAIPLGRPLGSGCLQEMHRCPRRDPLGGDLHLRRTSRPSQHHHHHCHHQDMQQPLSDHQRHVGRRSLLQRYDRYQWLRHPFLHRRMVQDNHCRSWMSKTLRKPSRHGLTSSRLRLMMAGHSYGASERFLRRRRRGCGESCTWSSKVSMISRTSIAGGGRWSGIARWNRSKQKEMVTRRGLTIAEAQASLGIKWRDKSLAWRGRSLAGPSRRRIKRGSRY
mmetsp:Transcript_6202/g.14832  ORF Transcript_6202/g.14832 Transcript_6202/m.14832 type:complete len:220 (-) Transcript_6202:1233-1892(-)